MKKITRIFKIIWVFFWACAATCVLFFPIFIAALLSRTGNLAFTLSKIWAWVILAVTRVRPRVRGKEKIDPSRSYIIISNHQSHFDILALVTTLGMQFRWVIKKEILKIPLFGYALYASRNIFINRSNHEKAVESMEKAMKRLPGGVSVMVFAEGTRSPDGSIRDFKKGGFRMALEKGIPILPVTVNGSRKILPKKELVYRSGPIEVVVGDPVDTSGFSSGTIEELIKKTRQAVIANFNPGFPEKK